MGALSAFYRDAADVHDPEEREMAAIRIIAKMPTLAAIAYKQSIGELAEATTVVTSVLLDTSRPLPTTLAAHMFIVPAFPRAQGSPSCTQGITCRMWRT